MSVAVPPAPAESEPSATSAATAAAGGEGGAGGGDGGEEQGFGQRIGNIVNVSPPRPGTMTRIKYCTYLFAALVFCMMFRGLLSKFFGSIPYYRSACAVTHVGGSSGAATTTAAPSSGNHWTLPNVPIPSNYPGHEIVSKLFNDECLQATVVYRISFSLFMFFILHFCCVTDLTCCIQDSVRDEMQSGYFSVKTIILVFLNLIAFGMPTSFFGYYAWACMYASGLFLVIQIILIVDFAYEWNEEWGKRGEENDKWFYYLLFITVGCFVSGIAMTGYGFANYTPHQDCNLHGFLLIANIMIAVILLGVSIWVPYGSLLPTGIIFSYTTYLVISALRSSPDTRCGGMGGDLQPNTSWWTLLFTALLTAGALAYTASSVGASDESFELDEAGGGGVGFGGGGGGEGVAGGNRYLGHLPAYMYFHAIMALASMYLAMLATDWTVSGTENGQLGGATVSFWVKIASSWLTYIIYFWSLIAPMILKTRDFGYDLPDDW